MVDIANAAEIGNGTGTVKGSGIETDTTRTATGSVTGKGNALGVVENEWNANERESTERGNPKSKCFFIFLVFT